MACSRAWLAAALAFGVTSFAVDARADDSGTEGRSPHMNQLPPWSFRLSAGGGAPMPGPHEDLLGEEGYSGPRWAFTAALERRLYGVFGIGAMGLYGFRSLDASLREGATEFTYGSLPHYSERFWIGAAEVPFTFVGGRLKPTGEQWVELAVVPFIGVGFATLAVHGAVAWHPGPAYGATARVFVRGRHGGAGLAVGAYSLRVAEPATVTPSIDFGMILVSAIGGFDVG